MSCILYTWKANAMNKKGRGTSQLVLLSRLTTSEFYNTSNAMCYWCPYSSGYKSKAIRLYIHEKHYDYSLT